MIADVDPDLGDAVAADLGSDDDLNRKSVVSADGYSYVFVLKADNTVERRRIETGGVRDSEIEVTSGIEAGDMIVGKGAGFLKDGDLVNVSSEAAGS